MPGIAVSVKTNHDLDLSTRLLRMLVPASLACGFVLLYPAIADEVVARFGIGFRPGLVAIYVATLVVLFLVDATLRDRRWMKLQGFAAEAERRAETESVRARELELVLDLSSILEREERIECALGSVLDRLRGQTPFTCGAIYAPDPASLALVRRGVCPLTALPSPSAEALAREVCAAPAQGESTMFASVEGSVAFPLILRGETLGAMVLEGVSELSAAEETRLRTAADRIAAAFGGRRLLSDLDAKERALRQAWHELRNSGRRLARSAADAEAAAVAEAAGHAILEPARAARRDLRAIRRSLVERDADECGLARIDDRLAVLEAIAKDLLRRGVVVAEPTRVDLNDLVVAAVDLVTPELRRAKIDVRMRLDHELQAVFVAEGPLYHVVVRLLRRLRAELRRTPGLRRLEVSTRSGGDGGRIEMRANTAGMAGHEATHDSGDKTLNENDLERARPAAWKVLLRTAKVRVRSRREIGEGTSFTIIIPGVQKARLL